MTKTVDDLAAAVAIPLVEERVSVGKRAVETGRVRVETRVDIIEQPIIATLASEQVEVTRVPVGRVVAEAPPVREVDGTTVIPVLEERLVVSRELVLVEEVRLRRIRTEQDIEDTVTRRAMRAVVDRRA